MTTLAARAELSEAPEWQRRVRQAMISAALDVASESEATANHAARRALAGQVLANPDGWARTFSYGAAQNPNVGGGGADDPADPDLGDSSLQWVINGLWDAYTAPERKSSDG